LDLCLLPRLVVRKEWRRGGEGALVYVEDGWRTVDGDGGVAAWGRREVLGGSGVNEKMIGLCGLGDSAP
jgi:hypothetical protein